LESSRSAADARLFQRLDLVGHQGDQGRDDQAQAGRSMAGIW
jgi:hypothetical protein